MEKECRVCLDNSGPMIHIFDGTQELDVSIAAMISEWCGYPVERGDSQPEYICQHCLKCAQTEFGRGHTHEDRHQMLYHVKEEDIAGGEAYRITDIEDRRSYLVQVKAETPEDETGETEIHALHGQVKNEPIVDEQSKLEADSEINHVINEESDEDLLEKVIEMEILMSPSIVPPTRSVRSSVPIVPNTFPTHMILRGTSGRTRGKD